MKLSLNELNNFKNSKQLDFVQQVIRCINLYTNLIQIFCGCNNKKILIIVFRIFITLLNSKEMLFSNRLTSYNSFALPN